VIPGRKASRHAVPGSRGLRPLPTRRDVAAGAASASAIKSFELNRRLPLGRFDGDFLYGFRWVEWNDGFGAVDVTETGAQTGADVFLSETVSSLYGAQVGLENPRWSRMGAGGRLTTSGGTASHAVAFPAMRRCSARAATRSIAA